MITYREITTVDEWKECYQAAASAQSLLVFKHSTTCPISAAAYQQYLDFLNKADEQVVQCILVKVIESRPVSNQIAMDLDINHESPQAILIENGTPVWNASHWKITSQSLEEAIKK